MLRFMLYAMKARSISAIEWVGGWTGVCDPVWNPTGQ